ncbi:MAG: hypothetical protein ACI4IQ_00355, partial [Eubacterium sp.]
CIFLSVICAVICAFSFIQNVSDAQSRLSIKFPQAVKAAVKLSEEIDIEGENIGRVLKANDLEYEVYSGDYYEINNLYENIDFSVEHSVDYYSGIENNSPYDAKKENCICISTSINCNSYIGLPFSPLHPFCIVKPSKEDMQTLFNTQTQTYKNMSKGEIIDIFCLYNPTGFDINRYDDNITYSFTYENSSEICIVTLEFNNDEELICAKANSDYLSV